MKPFLLSAACSFLLSFACQAGEPDLKPLFAAMETKWPKNRTFNIVYFLWTLLQYSIFHTGNHRYVNQRMGRHSLIHYH